MIRGGYEREKRSVGYRRKEKGRAGISEKGKGREGYLRNKGNVGNPRERKVVC